MTASVHPHPTLDRVPQPVYENGKLSSWPPVTTVITAFALGGLAMAITGGQGAVRRIAA